MIIYDHNNIEEKKQELNNRQLVDNLKARHFIPRKISDEVFNKYGIDFNLSYLKSITCNFTKPIPYWLGYYSDMPLSDIIRKDNCKEEHPVIPANALLPLPIVMQDKYKEGAFLPSINIYPDQSDIPHFKEPIRIAVFEEYVLDAENYVEVLKVNGDPNDKDYYAIVANYYNERYVDGAPGGGITEIYHCSIDCLHYVESPIENALIPVIYSVSVNETEAKVIDAYEDYTLKFDKDGFIVGINFINSKTILTLA